MGLRKWKEYSSKEEQFIIDNYYEMEHKEIAGRLGRSVGSVRDKYIRLRKRRRKELLNLCGQNHLSTLDILEFELKENVYYKIKDTTTHKIADGIGYLGRDKTRARVIKNYNRYILFQIKGRKESIQKVDLMNGNVEYEEV